VSIPHQVGCEHHSVHADVLQQEVEQVILEEGAGCEPEVVLEVLRERLLENTWTASQQLLRLRRLGDPSAPK
jgi:hypothetical protein